MKCPNCKEDSRIRNIDNFCCHCGFDIKAYRERMKRWPGAILNVDGEVQGSSEVVTELNKLRKKVDEQLDERVVSVTIKKRRAADSSPSQVGPNAGNSIS